MKGTCLIGACRALRLAPGERVIVSRRPQGMAYDLEGRTGRDVSALGPHRPNWYLGQHSPRPSRGKPIMLRKATPERLNAFSDGVFAVLITVLVLELQPRELPTFDALLSLWPRWLSYAV
jgi:transmembrane protein TMEM174 (potassium channel)